VAAASRALNEYRQGHVAESRVCIDTAQALCRASTGSDNAGPGDKARASHDALACDANVTSTIALWSSRLPPMNRVQPVGGRRLPHNLEGVRVRDFSVRDVGRFTDDSSSIMVWDDVLDAVSSHVSHCPASFPLIHLFKNSSLLPRAAVLAGSKHQLHD